MTKSQAGLNNIFNLCNLAYYSLRVIGIGSHTSWLIQPPAVCPPPKRLAAKRCAS